MKKELKTLKDIEGGIDEYYVKYYENIRQEAIKWVKYYDKISKSSGCLRRGFIMDFFSLTERKLKEGAGK